MIRRKKILYLNCTAINSHIGCLAVTDSHLRELLSVGYDIPYIYHTYETRFIRKSTRPDALKVAREAQVFRHIEACDAVVINGEGSIHHNGGRDLLTLAELSLEANKPVFLVNCVMQDVEGYDDVLREVSDLTVREVRSASYLEKKGISCRIVPDSILGAKFSNVHTIDYGGGVVCTDWQAQRDLDVGDAICRYMSSSQGKKASFMPLHHNGYAIDEQWRHAVANLKTAGIVVTGRHHAVYLAGLAGVPFVALPSNTHKIEGLIEMSGLSIPICTDVDSLPGKVKWARNNPSIFKEFQSFLHEEGKKLDTFSVLTAKLPPGRPRMGFQMESHLRRMNSEMNKKREEREFTLIYGENSRRVRDRKIIQEQERKISALKGRSQKDNGPNRELLLRVSEAISKRQYDTIQKDLETYTSLCPRDHEALYNLGLLYVYTGEVEKGVSLLHYRSFIPGFRPANAFNDETPVWDGKTTPDKVLIWSTAGPGIGTEVFLFSFLKPIAQDQDNMLVSCDPRLLPAFRRSFPGIHFCGYDDIGPNARSLIKHQCSMLSLLHLYFDRVPKSDRDSPHEPYLQCDKARRDKLIEEYSKQEKRRKTGISWMTSNIKSAHARSLPDDVVNKICRADNDTLFVSLQHDGKSSPLYKNSSIYFDDRIDPRTDIDGLIAQVAAMDHVITIDNSIAFIAGALGIPATLFLSAYSNWPWEVWKAIKGLYPNVRVIQQQVSETWSQTVERFMQPGLY